MLIKFNTTLVGSLYFHVDKNPGIVETTTDLLFTLADCDVFRRWGLLPSILMMTPGKAKQVTHLNMNLQLAPVQSVTNIYEYSNIQIYQAQIFIRTFVRVNFVCMNIFGHSFMSVLESENRPNIRIFVQFSIRIFIRTFVRVKFLIQIYSDIHSCKFFDTNIFGYSFVSKFLRMSHSGVHEHFTVHCAVVCKSSTSRDFCLMTKTSLSLLCLRKDLVTNILEWYWLHICLKPIVRGQNAVQTIFEKVQLCTKTTLFISLFQMPVCSSVRQDTREITFHALHRNI